MAHQRIHATGLAFGTASPSRTLHERLGPTGIMGQIVETNGETECMEHRIATYDEIFMILIEES